MGFHLRLSARLVWAIGVVAVLALGALPAARADWNPDWTSPAQCGTEDTPETGIQGDVPRADQLSGRALQGYNCGLAVVAHVGPDELLGAGAGDLAWSGDCAYVVAGPGTIALDMSTPTAPKVTDILPGTGGGSENIHAVTTSDRAILVTTQGSAVQNPRMVDVWDVSTCTNPELLGTIDFGDYPHNITLNPDATAIYASFGVKRANISDLGNPSSWTVEDISCDLLRQYHPKYQGPVPCESHPAATSKSPSQMSHEFAFSRDGSRLYFAGQLPGPNEEMVVTVDLTREKPTVLSAIPGPGHGIRSTTIGGREFLLHSDETAIVAAFGGIAVGAVEGVAGPVPVGMANPSSTGANGCVPDDATPAAGAAESLLTDVSDGAAPRTVAELELAINDPANCAAQIASGVRSTVHYNEFDGPNNAEFAMLPMGNAGLRLFDVSDPTAPTEVAYFNPGQFLREDGSRRLDSAGKHTRYDPQTGYIWLTTGTGLWVLELEPQVRDALGLPTLAGLYPNGRPAKPGALPEAVIPIPTAEEKSLFVYCSI